MTRRQLMELYGTLLEFRTWMGDRPLEIGLDDALKVVLLAVSVEADEARKQEA